MIPRLLAHSPSVLVGILVASIQLSFGIAAFAVTIDPSDSNISYTGRWNDSDTSQPWAQAKGSSIIANFQGTSVGVTMNTANGDYFRVIIDDDAAGSSKTQITSGSPVTLASDLSAGVHKVEIVKENDAGRVTLLGIELDAGQSLATPPLRPPRKIVFYGDSNLAGYSLESERNQGGNQRIGSYYTYAGITARMFDAEYHNISKSGATINSLKTSYDRIDWGFNNTPWNFSLFPADVVVVNIGANDVGTAEATIRSRYHTLLTELRSKHPASHIMLYNAFGWDFNEPANYIHEVIAERSDANMSSATFPWVFEQFHGCETDHAGMAQYLVEHLTTEMGWTAAPTDVVSGYGANGGVANGSFEQRAPFGGWGWRYFDDSGVSRVFDPSGAYDGDYHLRLSDGASSQQTNPAIDEDPVSVTVWMRGASNGDQADITIDFRNQGQGAGTATPMQSATETKTLTTDWQQFSMMSTAPTSPPNPVYATRVTFEAAAGGTVDVDDVVVFIPEPSAWMQLTCGFASLMALHGRRKRKTLREIRNAHD